MPYTEFSLEAVAEYLHVAKADVEQLVRRDEIPHEHLGDRIVFRKKEVDAWASQRILQFSKSGLSDYHKKTSAKYHDLSATHAIIPELIRAEFIAPNLASKTKSSLLRAMTEVADATGLLIYKDDLLDSLLEREQMCSTALAGGIALLHPRNHDPYMFEDSFVCIGRTVHPIPFGSPDGRTTDLFILACCQDDRIHLHVLARLCMVFYHTSVLLELREAESAEPMLEALVRAEVDVTKRL